MAVWSRDIPKIGPNHASDFFCMVESPVIRPLWKIGAGWVYPYLVDKLLKKNIWMLSYGS